MKRKIPFSESRKSIKKITEAYVAMKKRGNKKNPKGKR